jgi:hypothetical protein
VSQYDQWRLAAPPRFEDPPDDDADDSDLDSVPEPTPLVVDDEEGE